MADKKTKAEAEQAEPVKAETAPKAEKKAAKAKLEGLHAAAQDRL